MKRIIYDLELTCWEGQSFASKQEIIEIAAFQLNEYGDIDSEFQSFIQPVLAPYLSNYCKQLTGIQQQDISRAETFDQIIEDFRYWLPDEELLFIAWGHKDEKFLKADCDQHEIDTHWIPRHLDLKKSYALFHGLNHTVGLKKALQYEGIEFEGQHHRAYWDAWNTTELYRIHMGTWPG